MQRQKKLNFKDTCCNGANRRYKNLSHYPQYNFSCIRYLGTLKNTCIFMHVFFNTQTFNRPGWESKLLDHGGRSTKQVSFCNERSSQLASLLYRSRITRFQFCNLIKINAAQYRACHTFKFLWLLAKYIKTKSSNICKSRNRYRNKNLLWIVYNIIF